jgi:CHAD domain-containing protein
MPREPASRFDLQKPNGRLFPSRKARALFPSGQREEFPMDDANEAAIPDEAVEATPAEQEFPHPVDYWGKVRQLALRQLDRFMSFEPKVLRGDDPDAIHDMRVASRRLQQILDLLYPPPRPREIRRLRRRIRRCRRALGEVRNCDVLLAQVHDRVARKRAARREAWTAIHHYLLARRAESFLRALRKLSRINLAIFYVRLRESLEHGGPSPEGLRHTHGARPLESAVVAPFPEHVAQTLSTVWGAFEEQVELSRHDARAPVIHGVRIAAKRLRYLLEVLHEFHIAGSGEALAWLRQLQQHLGDWHDLEVLEQMIVEMIARPELLREQLPLVMQIEKLMLRNRTAKQAFQEKYDEMIKESAGLQRLEDVAAYLVESPSAAFAKA